MEDIKLLVQEEGRTARNLVAFNVPVIQTDYDSSRLMKKPPTSPRSQLDVRKEDSAKCNKRSRESSQSGSRVRSASTGRDKKSELHARYWAFLFGNLHRAVDEIYQTCESDESVTECKEVIMVLDNYTREFRNLINWFKIKWEYETTPPPQRPRSLAWEIRKSSPGKIRHKSLEPVTNENVKVNKPVDNNIDLIISKNEEQGSALEQITNSLNLLNTSVHNASNDAMEPNFSIFNCSVPSNDIEPHLLKNNIDNNSKTLAVEKIKTSDVSLPDTQELSLKSEKIEALMVDEVCQTDPEKDVDENGPKYISTSQQTCSVLTGFKNNNSEKKENVSGETKKETCKGQSLDNFNNSTVLSGVSKTVSKTKILEENQSKPSLGISTRTSSNQNLGTVRSAKNSYSVVTNQPKTINSTQSVSKVGTFGRLSRTVTSNKISTTQRQPWGARPLSCIPGKLSATGTVSPATARLTRSRTIAEVRRSERDSLGTIKSTKTTNVKQPRVLSSSISSRSIQIKQAKPSSVSSNKINSVPSEFKEAGRGKVMTNNSCPGNPQSDVVKSDNSNSNTSLSSSTCSTVKYQETSGSVEVLNVQEKGEIEEDEGWVKVRSKSRFPPATKCSGLETTLSRSASNLKPKDQKGIVKMVQKTRFHQPSSAISLPTLAFSNSDCKENISSKKIIKVKTDVKNKSKENVKNLKKPEKTKTEEVNNKKKNDIDKFKRNSNRLLNEKNFNETVKTDNYMHKEKLENEKNKSMDEKMLNKSVVVDSENIDEDENRFDEEIKKNKEKEEMLQKEINELEATDIEIDIETGDEETDGEATTGTEEELDQEKKSPELHSQALEKKSSPKKQHRYEEILSGMSWADHMDTLDELEKLVVQDCSKKGMSKDEQMDTLERLEEFVARHPGRALELHQKLSSPSRRRTMLDTVKRFQARQAKASEKREQLKLAKAQKLRELLKKVDEVKAAKDKLIEDRRQRLEMKLKRAAENRNLHLKEIMRKAHDEEEKLKEIAFINELEAQNKRHDFMTQCQEQEGRLQGIHEERQRKQEEKAAKEAAVEERRKAIEAERQEKLEKMQERQRKRDEQADKKKQEKEKERQELAREKARDRSERLEALHAAQLEAQEELQKKIQQKQEEYARRHEENIEQIRQKALELSILKCSDDVAPRLAPYETQKLCTACNVLIVSEVYLLSHLRGKKHLEALKNQMNGKELSKEEVERYNIKIIVNAPSDKIDPKIALDKQRIKSFKKKCKKIRQRMVSKGDEYLAKLENMEKFDSLEKAKLQKSLKEIEKAISSQGKGQWSDAAITILERSMGGLGRTLSKQDSQDQLVFRSLNGFSTLSSILQLDMEVPENMTPYLPQKCFVTTSSTYLAAIDNCSSNCKFVIFSNKIITLLDLLLKRLTVLIPDSTTVPIIYHSKSSLAIDPVASMVMRVIAKILICVEETESSLNSDEEYLLRLQDIISYTVSVGIVDKLTRYCKFVRDPIDDDPLAAQFLLSALELLTTLTTRCKTVRQGNEDPTQLLATLEVTELVGAVSILYGMLLHQGTPPRLVDASPPTLPSHTIAVALGTIRLLRSVAELDLRMFQSILGAEGISLQFRHIASYLLWYCYHDKEKILLHEVVALVGYFAVQHRDNQMILQSGSTPTVLQQLCNLPFPYFSNPELSALLFPTLLACCSDNDENKAILEQEISYSLLENFLESEVAKTHPLIHLLSPRLKCSKS